MCARCVNVFITVEELWEGFETALALILCKSSWVAFCSYLAWRSVGGVNHFYNPRHLGVVNFKCLIIVNLACISHDKSALSPFVS